jgi:hypothetical protein
MSYRIRITEARQKIQKYRDVEISDGLRRRGKNGLADNGIT